MLEILGELQEALEIIRAILPNATFRKKSWLEINIRKIGTVTVLPFHLGEVTFKGNPEIWFLSCDIIGETLWISLEGLFSAFTAHACIALLTTYCMAVKWNCITCDFTTWQELPKLHIG